jgi:hypothetical protein
LMPPCVRRKKRPPGARRSRELMMKYDSWYPKFSVLEKIGLWSLVVVGGATVVVVAFPETVAAAVGGAMVAAGGRVLAGSFGLIRPK